MNEISRDLDCNDKIHFKDIVNLYPMLAPSNMVKIFQGTSSK